jgi:hypothetical protein
MLWIREKSFLCQESNQDSSILRPIAWSIYIKSLYLYGERYVELEEMWIQRPEEVM